MSTNAHIGIKNKNGTIRYVYLHWDGYPGWAGKILVQHYNTIEKINELLDVGDISSIDPTIKKSVFYTRDRNEIGCFGYTVKNLAAFKRHAQEWNYLFDEELGYWKVSYNSGRFVKLTDKKIKENN